MSDNALRLLDDSEESKPKPTNWKIERVEYWRMKYAEVNGREPKEGWSQMMGMMQNAWVSSHSYTDEETGEIRFDIPPIEDWKSETEWFFRDKWAAEKFGFSFAYFIKRYGQWEKKTVIEKPIAKRQSNTTRVMIHCSGCGKNHYSDEGCK